ncbi:MAG: sugar phosphate isomerase/epimerase [Zavarzinella sp.]
MKNLSRRQFHHAVLASTSFAALPTLTSAAPGWQPRYLLPSCMYGYAPLAEILPETAKIGAVGLDIWPKVHGNQREQLDEMGVEKFQALLKHHQVKLECITQYKLGPFGLTNEMKLAKELGCRTIVTGGAGPKDLTGDKLKSAIKDFLGKMAPHLKQAEDLGITIAIENHGNNLIFSPDSIRWLAELSPSKNLAIALAPYHLPQEEKLLVQIIRDLGPRVAMFYAWQYGNGCMKKMPKDQELQQMPGRGKLDFGPIVAELANNRYLGWVEIFMHPTPRGLPILDTTKEVTAEINLARNYLQKLIPT